MQQLILKLLNKDFNFTDNELHDALRRSSRGLFNTQHGLGRIIQRFANGEFQNDALIGEAFVVTKTTLKINDLAHLYNLAQAFQTGDAARKIKQNYEKYAICLALICHQQAKKDLKDFDFKYLEELRTYYATDTKMTAAIIARRLELMNASTRKLSVKSVASIVQPSQVEEMKNSPKSAVVQLQELSPKQEQVRAEINAQQATKLAPSSSVPVSTTLVSLNRVSLNDEGSKKKVSLTIEIPKSSALGSITGIGGVNPLDSPFDAATDARPIMPSIHIDTSVSSEKKGSPDLRSPSSPERTRLSPSSPVIARRLSPSLPGTPLKSLHQSADVSPRALANKEQQEEASQTSKSAGSPSIWSSTQEALEKARWWKTALAITVAILTLPTFIIPLLSYFVWKRAKENEAVQKIEGNESRFTTVDLYRQGLNSPKLAQEITVVPEQLVAASNENDKAARYLLNGQAKQFRFYEDRMKQGQTAALNEKERQLLLNYKEEDVRVATYFRD